MGLDEQQRQAFQEAVQKDGDKLRGLEEKLRPSQKELLDSIVASEYDEKAVRSKTEAAAKIQIEVTMLRAKALGTVAATMKPQQKKQLAESPAAIMLLHGGGLGMMRGGGFPGGRPGIFSNAPWGPGGFPGPEND